MARLAPHCGIGASITVEAGPGPTSESKNVFCFLLGVCACVFVRLGLWRPERWRAAGAQISSDLELFSDVKFLGSKFVADVFFGV